MSTDSEDEMTDSSSSSSSSSSTSSDSSECGQQLADIKSYLRHLSTGLSGGVLKNRSFDFERKIFMRRDLLCESTVWRKEFLSKLNQYSVAKKGPKLDSDAKEVCLACGKRASYYLHLTGKKYDASALWACNKSSEIQKIMKLPQLESVNEDGIIPVGPGCMKIGLYYHKLHHYKLYILNSINHSKKKTLNPKGVLREVQKLFFTIEDSLLSGDSSTVGPQIDQTTLDRWASLHKIATGIGRAKRSSWKPAMAASEGQLDIRKLIKPRTPPRNVKVLQPAKPAAKKQKLQQSTLFSSNFITKKKKKTETEEAEEEGIAAF